jgi:serine phosphatase RsbU (regulator of sigma subunit)
VRQESLPLGRFRRAVYRNEELRVFPGDRLLLYTDGVTEALSPGGEPFGDERLREVLESPSEAPDRLANALLARLSQWSSRPPGEPLDDDVTLVVAELR